MRYSFSWEEIKEWKGKWVEEREEGGKGDGLRGFPEICKSAAVVVAEKRGPKAKSRGFNEPYFSVA